MSNVNLENLNYVDRITRITTGVLLSMSVLLVPYEAAWIAAATLASAYPLITGLTAFDPILAALVACKQGIQSIRSANYTARV